MNETLKLYFLAAVTGSLLALPGAGIGHGNETHVPEYDPVDTEFGIYDPGLEVDRTIAVDMDDSMRFTPSRIRVEAGEVVRFELSNSGQLMHEFVLGTRETLDHHAEMMKKFPGMEHDEPYMAHVAPGKSGVVVWKFDKPGVYSFGCLIPGHYDAGMKGEVVAEN